MPVSIVDGKAGVAFFLSPNVALELTAGYQSTVEQDKSMGFTDTYRTGSFVAGFGFQIYLGSTRK